MVVLIDLLFTLQPNRHLRKFVLVISGGICVLRQIDVKPLCVFSVEIVRGAIKLDEVDIVACEMKLRDIKMVTDSKVNKYRFVFMKT